MKRFSEKFCFITVTFSPPRSSKKGLDPKRGGALLNNVEARYHVKKGMFALFTGVILMLFYQRWEVTRWLGEVDNVWVTMIVIIVPLVLITEMNYLIYHLLKDKLENIVE